MKAVVVHGADDLRIDELPDPVAGEREVLVAMEWGGICGSDISYWRNGSSGTATLRHPLILGHEVAGYVAGIGAGVCGIDIGMPVTAHPATAGGGYFGSAARHPHTDGGFSQLKVIRADQIRPLPDGVGTELGALAEPLAVAMHAVTRAGAVAGRDILVNGAGPIGSLVVAAARHAGAASVTAVDIADAPLAIAMAMGADHTVNIVAGQDLPDDIDVIFEVSGAAGALGSILRTAKRGGTVVQVGNLPGTPIRATLGDLVTRELCWVGSYRFDEEITDAIAAMAHGLDVAPIVTHRYPLAQAQRAIEVAADRGTGSGKVLLALR